MELYRYDDAGNLLQDAKNTYEYDAFRRTSKVTTKAGDVQINRYDAEGLRCEMEENGKLVQFIFNENKKVITEETDGNITKLIRTSDLWARESEPEKTWYHYASDEQGSTVFITDEQGNLKFIMLICRWESNLEQIYIGCRGDIQREWHLRQLCIM